MVGTGTPTGPVDECTRTYEFRAIYYSTDCASNGCTGYRTSPVASSTSGNSQCGVSSRTTGTNYLIREQRLITTAPAEADGSVTYGSWGYASHSAYNTYTVTVYGFGCGNGGGSDR